MDDCALLEPVQQGTLPDTRDLLNAAVCGWMPLQF